MCLTWRDTEQWCGVTRATLDNNANQQLPLLPLVDHPAEHSNPLPVPHPPSPGRSLDVVTAAITSSMTSSMTSSSSASVAAAVSATAGGVRECKRDAVLTPTDDDYDQTSQCHYYPRQLMSDKVGGP